MLLPHRLTTPTLHVPHLAAEVRGLPRIGELIPGCPLLPKPWRTCGAWATPTSAGRGLLACHVMPAIVRRPPRHGRHRWLPTVEAMVAASVWPVPIPVAQIRPRPTSLRLPAAGSAFIAQACVRRLPMASPGSISFVSRVLIVPKAVPVANIGCWTSNVPEVTTCAIRLCVRLASLPPVATSSTTRPGIESRLTRGLVKTIWLLRRWLQR